MIWRGIFCNYRFNENETLSCQKCSNCIAAFSFTLIVCLQTYHYMPGLLICDYSETVWLLKYDWGNEMFARFMECFFNLFETLYWLLQMKKYCNSCWRFSRWLDLCLPFTVFRTFSFLWCPPRYQQHHWILIRCAAFYKLAIVYYKNILFTPLRILQLQKRKRQTEFAFTDLSKEVTKRDLSKHLSQINVSDR